MHDIIFIPTNNERTNIRVLISEIFELLPEIHVLVIDDNSPDGTGAEVKKLMQTNPNISLLERAKKEGLGAAYIDAFNRILHEEDIRAVVTMDADGSHPVEFLPALLAKIDTHEYVIGSRYIPGAGIENWSIWRRMLSQGGNLYARTLVGLGVRDLTAGFTATRMSLLKKIALNEISATGYAYQMEMKFHCIHIHKGSVVEVPIIFRERREGESKISNHIIREGLKVPLKLACKKWFRR